MPPPNEITSTIDDQEEPRDLQPAGHDRVAPLTREDVVTGLTRAERQQAARAEESLLRRRSDHELVEALRADGFQGHEYKIFENELARYGLAVMPSWLATGHVFHLTARRGRPQEPSERELNEFATSPDARDELASAVVAETLPWFRDRALLQGQWSPDGGASITTYFMGACVLQFPNRLRSWRQRQKRWTRQDNADALHLGRGAVDDPATIVAGDAQVMEHLSRLGPRARSIVSAHLAGYSHAAIAEMFGENSARAVEGVIYRWRSEEQTRRRTERERTR